MPSTPEVYAYIDETGDRGGAHSSSPIFGMAAVLVTPQGAIDLRAAVRQLRADFNVPEGVPMSWKNHVKTHDRRRRAVAVLGQVEELRVCYVYSVKSALGAGSYRDDKVRFYNWVAWMTYKSILWGARSWQGNQVRVWTRFGHVKHHDHRMTDAYIRSQASKDGRVPEHLEQGLKWVSADQYLESQAADLYGGFLKAATWASGDFGYVEGSYLMGIWHQIRNSEQCAVPLGIMSMPAYQYLHELPWFPCTHCPKRKSVRN